MAYRAWPYRPEPGWERRWLSQSFSLMWRAPAGLAWLIGGAWIAGSFVVAYPGDPDALSIGLPALIMGLVIVASIGELIGADGSDRPTPAHLLRQACAPVAWSVICASCAGLLLGLMGRITEIPWPIPAGSDPLSAMGQGAVSGGIALIATVGVNSLWIPGAAASGLSLQIAAIAGRIMMRRMRRESFALLFFPLIILFLMAEIGGVFAVGLLFMLITWTYVAAREIFGGIRRNGKPRASTRPANPGSAAARPM